jgi:hypothetical protein
MSKRFDQNRKEMSAVLDRQKQKLLSEYYDVPEKHIVNVEDEKDGEYNTQGKYDTVDFIDFAGIDWIVDDQPVFTGVSDRIRKNEVGMRDLSIRTENGVGHPCEETRLPEAIKNGGLYPRDMLYGWRSGFELTGAWIVDTAMVCQMLKLGYGEINGENKQTYAKYISKDDLENYGAVKATLVQT